MCANAQDLRREQGEGRVGGAGGADEVRALLYGCASTRDGALMCTTRATIRADYKLDDWRLFFFLPQQWCENVSFALIQVVGISDLRELFARGGIECTFVVQEPAL